MRTNHLVVLAASLILVASGVAAAYEPVAMPSQDQTTDPDSFAGAYAELTPAQQRLIDGFIATYNELEGTSLGSDAYDNLPVSARTTFAAITNALMNTTLSDGAGQTLGTALDLVEDVDMVRGHVMGARGDMQFRIYVVLRQDALEILDKSRQFSRHADNTIYHTDYPINYRQSGGIPSIQFSIAADQIRADIDVDYRSTALPKVLFDGHLTAANSDVRAGDNYDRHVNRWGDLLNWWHNLFGFYQGDTPQDEEVEVSLMDPIPATPRVSADAELTVAVEDFLTSWIVEAEPAQAMAYFSESAYNCVSELEESSESLQMAPLRILEDMRHAAQMVGEVSDLSGVVGPAPIANRRVSVIEHENAALFELARVPQDLAAALMCKPHGAVQTPLRFRSLDRFYAASFRLTDSGGEEVDLLHLWHEDAGEWKLVALHLDVGLDVGRTLEIDPGASAGPVEPLPRAPADPELAQVVDDFLSDWLLARDYDRVVDYFAPHSHACMDLLHAESGASRATGRAAERQLVAGLSEIAEFVGQPAELGDGIRAAEPWNPDLRLMEHDAQQTYALLALPDRLAHSVNCANRAAGRHYAGHIEEGVYGNYFAVLFQLETAGGHGPILAFLWSKDGGEWQITSYNVLMP